MCQLFDLKNDRWEMRNVAAESRYSGALSEMRKRQQQWDARLEKYPGAPVSNTDAGDEDSAPRQGVRRRRATG